MRDLFCPKCTSQNASLADSRHQPSCGILSFFVAFLRACLLASLSYPSCPAGLCRLRLFCQSNILATLEIWLKCLGATNACPKHTIRHFGGAEAAAVAQAQRSTHNLMILRPVDPSQQQQRGPPAEPEGDIKSALQDAIDELCGALGATRTIISGSVANDAWKTTLKAQSISKRARTTRPCSSGQLDTASLPSAPLSVPALPCPHLQAVQHYVDLTASSDAMCPYNTRRSHASCNSNRVNNYSPDKDAPPPSHHLSPHPTL